jgi:hypothetical protein
MHRSLAIVTIAVLFIVPAVLIQLDVIAFDYTDMYVGVLALLCISPVALIGIVALTVAMEGGPMLRTRLGTTVGP